MQNKYLKSDVIINDDKNRFTVEENINKIIYRYNNFIAYCDIDYNELLDMKQNKQFLDSIFISFDYNQEHNYFSYYEIIQLLKGIKKLDCEDIYNEYLYLIYQIPYGEALILNSEID